MTAVCVDVGKTTTRVGVWDDAWASIDRFPTDNIANGSKTEFLTKLEEEIKTAVGSMGIEPRTIDRIAVAAPGPVDRMAESAYFLHDQPLEIEWDTLSSPTHLVNDATSGAVAEHRLGGHDTNDLLYVTISTSIGGGLILNNNVIDGWRGNAGELGHLKLADCNIPCPWCDETGHWMGACSGSQLPTLAKSIADLDISDASELFEKANSGDPDANTVLNRMHSYNAEALTQLTNILNPEVIVLDGGVVLNNEQEIIQGIERYLGPGCVNSNPRVESATLGDNSVLEGLRIICTQSTGIAPVKYGVQ